MQRIRDEGPTISDLTTMVTVAEYDKETLSTKPLIYQFIPYSSFGKDGDVREPEWTKMT